MKFYSVGGKAGNRERKEQQYTKQEGKLYNNHRREKVCIKDIKGGEGFYFLFFFFFGLTRNRNRNYELVVFCNNHDVVGEANAR